MAAGWGHACLIGSLCLEILVVILSLLGLVFQVGLPDLVLLVGLAGSPAGVGRSREANDCPQTLHCGLRNTKKMTGSDLISNIKKVYLRNFQLLNCFVELLLIFKDFEDPQKHCISVLEPVPLSNHSAMLQSPCSPAPPPYSRLHYNANRTQNIQENRGKSSPFKKIYLSLQRNKKNILFSNQITLEWSLVQISM